MTLGRSRATNHTTRPPSSIKKTGRRKIQRQFRCSTSSTSSDVPNANTDDIPAANTNRPKARPRSLALNQFDTSRLPGAQPMLCASPFIPHATDSDLKSTPKLMNQFKPNEAIAPRHIMRRPPNLSPKLPLIICPTAYAQSIAALIQPSVCLSNFSSASIPGIAKPNVCRPV